MIKWPPEVTAEGSPALPTTLDTWLLQNHTAPLLLRLRGGKNVIVITTWNLQVVRVVGSAGDPSAVTPRGVTPPLVEIVQLAHLLQYINFLQQCRSLEVRRETNHQLNPLPISNNMCMVKMEHYKRNPHNGLNLNSFLSLIFPQVGLDFQGIVRKGDTKETNIFSYCHCNYHEDRSFNSPCQFSTY